MKLASIKRRNFKH